MKTDKNIVIVGCGAGGGTAAQFARKTDRRASITIVEKGKYPQYSKCGLPYVISGKISNFDNLVEFSEDWFKKSNIELKLETEVEKIDHKKKIVHAKKNNDPIEIPYDFLIIATGANPTIPDFQNMNSKGIYVVRTMDDVKRIYSHAKESKNATIVGAGFIGLEIAENLRELGLKISIVEAFPNMLVNRLDEDMGKIVSDHIPDDIKIFTNHKILKAELKGEIIKEVIIKDNDSNNETSIDTDLLIIATGIKPEVKLAEGIGCKIGQSGGIVTNIRCETSVKDVYAVGDCTEFVDFVTAKPVLVGLGSIAVRQGISAGINAAGGDYQLSKGLLNTSTSEFFGLEIASVGPTLKIAEEIFTVVTGRFNGSSLPDYYPGGNNITVKILVDKYTGMIIGAQAIGHNAAQRINTLACAILGELDIETLRKLETAYAPSVAPTLDAITLVCDIVSKKLSRK